MAFVERGTQSQVLSGLLDGCLDGTGAVVLTTGSVGSGKTQLLRRFAAAATDRGMSLLTATASRTERTLPLGVMQQLFACADLTPTQRERIDQLLSDGAMSAMLHDHDSETTQRVTAKVLQGMAGVLLDLAERTPLLIGVDDLHFVDLASLHCLLYLINRTARAPVMMVFNEAVWVRQPWPVIRADLLSQPQCHRIRLRPLTLPGVTSVLCERLGVRDARAIAPAYHDISGGSPLLLGALIEDGRATGRSLPGPVAGDAFAQAVTTCLYRGDATVLRLARVLATLAEPASPAALTDLLDVDAAAATRAIDTATEWGLLRDGWFRHGRARAAVLDAMAPEQRSVLHARAAHQLYKSGAPAPAVARHEVAARHVGPAWSAPVLREAADHALEHDDTSHALECLRLAQRASTTEAEQVTTKAALTRVQWRLDTRTASRNLDELVAAAHAGTLAGNRAVELTDYLLWHGRAADAVELLDHLTKTAPATDLDTATALYSARSRLAYTFPAFADRVPGGLLPPLLPAFGATTRSVSVRAAGLVGRLLADGLTDEVLADAEEVLQQSRLDDTTFATIMPALEMLVFGDRLEAAARWCAPMLEEADRRRVPTWCAQLSAVHAMICYRRGDPAGADRHARAALSYSSTRGLGVRVGLPLSILLLTDQEHDALHWPLPEAVFQTPYGLQYVRARGRYHLARENYRSAIAEFEACRDLMIPWRLDLPGVVPWRTDLAEAYLGLGQAKIARQLAQDQLAMLADSQWRTRGLSLRVLAAGAEPAERAAILEEAAEELRSGGDPVELARAVTALDEARRAVGGTAEAQRKPLVAALRRSEHRPQPLKAERRAGAEQGPAQLSTAEQRVAALAVQGHTNLQIARKLHVTVSTVEQHLTNVFRKLHVRRRTDLTVSLLRDQ
ncbi:helix-turn-helix transcriptional regulator [Phytohabitans houttuyneae]|uniref:HTH luxR-type domain-containing protein n=1 Tax=Phytohabitans houttuyneae TaxID=1076126 RepID=A0A6V8KJE9_9ACTN|nr:AAA family ATPase [Phytohabitans houttuyneae]GFJ80805.1 hypothetical protein Phou_049850 [Phytohabitans houttuyneae]